jgi:sugar transferase (PEP-CTERM system associated)
VRIFRHYLQLPIVILALVEAGVLVGLFFLAAGLRFDLSLAQVEAKLGALWPRAAMFGLLMYLAMVAVGLYSSRMRARFLGIVVRIGTSVILGTAASVLAFYALEMPIGRGVIGIAAANAFLGITLVRFIFTKVVDENLFKRRVLVFGCGRQALSISQLRRRSDQRGFTIVGYVRPDGDREMVPADRLLLPPQSLLELAREQRVDEIVVAMDDRRRSFPVQELLECRLCGIDVTDIVTFLERETGKVRLDVLNPSWMIFAEGFRRDPVRLFSERFFDLFAGSTLFLLTWPFMLLVSLAIKLEDGWRAPVLYRQKRVGLENQLFNVLKFRSMRIDAEKDGPRWAAKSDDRVTHVGSVIRKLRLDELPQIFNVLRGDMSFVGPRPERPEFVAELNEKIPYYRERHCVKPGITGWAQLCYPYGSSEHDAAEKLQYDLYYVKNHSLLFDLAILLQTAEVVLWGKGGR